MKKLTREDALHMLNKVPDVTLYFRIIKIMATTVGQTGTDFLNFNLKFGSLLPMDISGFVEKG